MSEAPNSPREPINLFPPVSLDGGSQDSGTDNGTAAAQPRIEGYQIVRLLGQGGMGTVWEAIQLSTNRRVAIKTLRGSQFDSPRTQRRFQHEIEVLAQLRHPHIAQLYDSPINRHIPYYVMEYVDGVPIDQYCQRERLAPRQIMELFGTVCRAIEYAQRCGFIHRDLKPSNILVRSDGSPCVLDFGLAKPMDADAGHRMTVEGAFAGTLAYTAPEQAAGSHSLINSAADVYSLGVVLFELLTGHLPHEPAESTFAFQKRIVEKDAVSCRTLNRKLDNEIESLVAKSLARQADDRYASAGELANDIQRYLDGEPLAARRLTVLYLARRRIAQHRLVFALTVLAVCMATAGMAYAYWKIDHERQLAQTREVQRTQALYTSRIREAYHAYQRGDLAYAQTMLRDCPEQYRHWEWHYLSKVVDQSSWTFSTPTYTRSIALSPAGDTAYALDSTGSLHVWSLESPGSETLISTTRLTEKHIQQDALDDSLSYAAFAVENQVEIFNLASRAETHVDLPDNVIAKSVRLSSTGKMLASLLNDNTILLWDTREAAAVRREPLPEARRHMAFSGEEVYCYDDKAVYRWSMDHKAPSFVASLPTDDVVRIAISANGEKLYAATKQGMVFVADVGSQFPKQPTVTLENAIVDMDVASVGERWAVVSGRTLFVNTGSSDDVIKLRGHTADVRAVKLDADGDRIISSAGNVIKVWNLSHWSPARHDIPQAPQTDPQFPPVFRSSGDRVLLFNFGGHHREYSLRDGLLLRTEQLDSATRSIAPVDEHGVISLTRDGVLMYTDWATREQVVLCKKIQPTGLCPLSPDGAYIQTRSNEEQAAVTILRTVSSEKPAVMIEHARSGVWSSDSGTFVANCLDGPGVLVAYATDTWTKRCILSAADIAGKDVKQFAVSSDGSTVAASTDNELIVWSIVTRQVLSRININGWKHNGATAVSNDGKRAMMVLDGQVAVVDIPTREVLIKLDQSENSPPWQVALSPDEKYLVGIGSLGDATIWSGE